MSTWHTRKAWAEPDPEHGRRMIDRHDGVEHDTQEAADTLARQWASELQASGHLEASVWVEEIPDDPRDRIRRRTFPIVRPQGAQESIQAARAALAQARRP